MVVGEDEMNNREGANESERKVYYSSFRKENSRKCLPQKVEMKITIENS